MTGRGRELTDMMERRNLDILCLQETKWKDSKARNIGGGCKLFYNGTDGRKNGIGTIVKEELAESVLEVKRVSDRLMAMNLEVKGSILNIVSTYASIFRMDFNLRQNKIEQVECIKFLGVYIQEHLTWSRHINHLISKLRSVLETIIKVKSLLSKRSLLLLYHSLLNSQLSYCILNLCYGNKTLVKRLQRLCYKFVELISGINSNSSVFDIMKENKFAVALVEHCFHCTTYPAFRSTTGCLRCKNHKQKVVPAV